MSFYKEPEDAGPHIIVWTGNPFEKQTAHIIPRSFFEDVIAGERAWTNLEGHREILPIILKEWLGYVDASKEAQQGSTSGH